MRTMAEAIRILHVLGSTNLGGAESRIMDIYRYIDREKVQFDFLVHQTEKGYYDDEIESLGGRIYRVPRFKLYNLSAYKKALRSFFAEHHEFQAVHGHMTSTGAIYLPIAKKSGIPMTIAHARSAGVDKGLKGKLTLWIRKPLKRRCDYMFACSGLAGEAVFGSKNTLNGKVKIIPNAIDVEPFCYSEDVRQRMREELNLDDRFVIGHVGRFHYAKNHEYLLDIFKEISLKQQNAVLLLLGEGSRMEEMKKKVKTLGIEEKVIFAGNKKETWDYYQAMDFFVFPSRFEGLPGTVVEAQSAGLSCLISDTIAKEVGITDLVAYKSIEENPVKWADYVLEHKDYVRENKYEQIAAAGYDVREQAKRYEQFYISGEEDCL